MVSQAVRQPVDVEYGAGERFVVPKAQYAPQYAQLYFCRLSQLRAAATKAAQRAWGAGGTTLHYAPRIVDIRSNTRADTVVLGIVFRDSASKPSILQEYSRATDKLIPDPPPARTSPYGVGTVVIEDENGRCVLDVEALPPSRRLTTGIVAAFRGREDAARGCFVVSDMVLPGPAPQLPISDLPADKYIAFLSAPRVRGGQTDIRLVMLREFLRGTVTDGEDATQLTYLVVTGPLLGTEQKALTDGSTNGTDSKAQVGNTVEEKAAARQELDLFLTAAAATMPVAVLPGAGDPVNHLLPQQPLHRCLLPAASRQHNLKRTPNPLACKLDGRFVMGTSGQPVRDMKLYGEVPLPKPVARAEVKQEETLDVKEEDKVDVKKEEEVAVKEEITEDGVEEDKKKEDVNDEEQPKKEEDVKMGDVKVEGDDEEEAQIEANRRDAKSTLDVLETMLCARHMAPTCPDTVAGYPFITGDPFVMERTPHILFAGDQAQFSTRLYGGGEENIYRAGAGAQCRMLALPPFHATGQVVLVSLRTLHCAVREFTCE